MSFLRETLTILAVLLVLALSAALAAPLFIDWNARRGWVEERLSAALGGEVRIAGNIDLRLLPAPSLDVAGAVWRAPGANVLQLEVNRVRLEIALTPLLQGAVRFVEARLDQPRLVAALASDGGLNLPQAGEKGGVVAFERIEIRGGEILLLRTGAEAIRVSGVEADADASSLRGPFRGSGGFATANGRIGFRFGAGVAEEDRIRIKVTTEPAQGAPQVDLDGALIAERAGAAMRLRFEGAAALWANAQADGVEIPWRASGTLAADLSGGRLEPMEVRFGPPERQSTASGAASIEIDARRITLGLSAPQIDADRLLDSKEAAGESMGRLSRILTHALERPARQRGFAIRLEASTPALQLGGETITDASLRLTLPTSGDDQLALNANLPGRSLVSLDGAIESGVAARFAGKARASSRDLPRLADWVSRADADFAERLRGLPFRALEVGGDIELSRSALAARDLDIRADRTTLRGSAAFTAALAGEPPRLFADFTSPALDLDSIPSLRGPARALQDADLNLSLDARAVRLAGVGGGVVDAGRIRGKLTRNGQRLELERLSVENLGGATLNASGLVDGDGANLQGRLEAQRLVELAALVRRVAPGPFADLLNERAVSLSPARFDVSAEAASKDGSFELRTLRVDGSARGSRITIAGRPDGDDIEAQADISSADTPMLLRQFGVETVPIRSAPASRMTLRAKGSLAKGFKTEGGGDIAGANIAYNGALGDVGGRFGFTGQARVATKDATPLMQVLAVAWPDAQSAIPVELAGELAATSQDIQAKGLKGAIAGARVAGDLRFAPSTENARRSLTGNLDVDSIALDAITALALGSPSGNRAAPLWSERAFASGIVDPPPTNITLRASQMNVRGLDGRDFAARLVLGNGAVALENLSLRIGQASVSGRAALRRDKVDASLSALLDLQTPVALPDQMSANAALRIELAATGRSERALVSNLAGAGRARLTDIVIARAAPAAIDTTVALAEKDAIAPDERTMSTALQKAFDAAPIRIPALDVDLLAANGVLRLQPVKIDLQRADATFAAALDLRTLSVEQTMEIVSRVTPPKWSEPNPRVRIMWSGPLQKPVRSIDAAQLVNGLSARAIQRESARIEALDADIRERAMFNRRLRMDEWRRQREAEIRAFMVEQERLEKIRLEAERKAEAERLVKEKQEQLRLEAERRAQEKQRLLEELNRPAPPVQLPGAVAPQ